MTFTRTPYLDILRSLAILGVVMIHVASPLVNMAWIRQPDLWWFGNIANALTRFAVPVFLMLSGATLLGKDMPLKDFYRRRYTKVLLPFLFWLPVYWVFRWLMLKPSQQPHDFLSIIEWAINLFLKEGISKHFWYVYMILFLYLLIPFLGKIIRKLSFQHIFYMLIVWLIITQITLRIPLNPYGWSGHFEQKLFGYLLYTGYLVLGYALSIFPFEIKKHRLIPALGYFISVCTGIFGLWYMSRGGKLNQTFHGYLHWNTILQTTSVFLFFKDITIKNSVVEKTVNLISDYSYGIYLVHILIIGTLFHYGIYWNFAHPLVSIPVLVTGVLGGSTGIIYIFRYLKKLFSTQ